jgi:hypothetical protein
MKIRSQLEVSRRQLLQMGLVTTAATLVSTGVESLFPPESLAQGLDPLPSWNDGVAKEAILNFVRVTTDSSSGHFVPPAERVACFDQDGTTWVEQPIYSQVVYCLNRVPDLVKAKPELANEEPFKTVMSGVDSQHQGCARDELQSTRPHNKCRNKAHGNTVRGHLVYRKGLADDVQSIQ